MLQSILKELAIRFKMLKESVINNNISADEAKTQINKLIFAANVVQKSISTNLDEITEEKINNIKKFKAQVVEFKEKVLPEISLDEENAQFIEDVKVSMAERIETQNLEEPTLEQ